MESIYRNQRCDRNDQCMRMNELSSVKDTCERITDVVDVIRCQTGWAPMCYDSRKSTEEMCNESVQTG